MKLELLEEQLDTEQKILDDLQKKLNPGPDPELVKKWEKIEKDVIDMIKEKMDISTQDEPELSQTSLENLYDSIRKHLKDKNYYKAYLIVKHTERQYPEAKLLRCDMEKSEQVIRSFSFVLCVLFSTSSVSLYLKKPKYVLI